MHERNSFVTLTYAPEHLPPDWSLEPKEVQRWLKRLRERVGPFRYYGCGEYGDMNGRPHYHFLLFGVDFSDDRLPLSDGKTGRLYTSKTLDASWKYGLTAIGEFTFESAAYVARYCLKKVSAPSMPSYSRIDSETGEYYEVEREFVRMSLRPGIGAKWFDLYKDDCFPSDEVVHKGRKFRVPRYYEGRIDPVFLEGVKLARLEKAVAETRERLEVSGRVAERRLTLYRRDL